LIPGFDGAVFSREWKEALWAKFFTGAPARQRRTEAEQAYKQRHFAIDWEREQVSCPQGKTSVTWRAGLDEVGASRLRAVFSRTDCSTCAARELCTSAKEARRSVYFHPRPEYEALNAARARMYDPAWKK
jgi:transposase